MRIVIGLAFLSLAACATAPAPGVADTAAAPAVAAAPAAAAGPNAAGVQQASLAGEDPNKKICRIKPGFGGAPGERICQTKQQWETEDSRAEATNESMQNSLNSRKAWVTGPVYQRPN